MRQLLEGLQLTAITAVTLRYTLKEKEIAKSVAGVNIEELCCCVVVVLSMLPPRGK
jgi:hypothetical protein